MYFTATGEKLKLTFVESYQYTHGALHGRKPSFAFTIYSTICLDDLNIISFSGSERRTQVKALYHKWR